MKIVVNKILSYFPLSHMRNVKLFYLIGGGMSFWLVEAVWYFYWSKLASFSQIGTIFAVLTLVWIFLEIPTGAIADMFGRKKSTTIGAFFLALGSISMVVATNFWYLIIGGLLQNMGRAFISGSLEALVYDDLKKNNLEESYDDVIAAQTKIRYVAYAIATLSGGFLYLVYFRLPHFLTALVDILVFSLTFLLVEIQHAKPPAQSFKNYLKQNLEGFKQLAKKELRPFIILIIAFETIFFLYDWGLSKATMAVNFGYNSAGQGIVYTIMALASAYLVGKVIYIRDKIGDFKGVILLNILLGLGFVLSAFPWGYFGVLVLFLIEISGAMSSPWISTIVNKHINSQDRATTLSSLEFVSKLPFIFLVFISGSQIENHTINKLHISIGATLLVIASVYLLFKKRLLTSVINK